MNVVPLCGGAPLHRARSHIMEPSILLVHLRMFQDCFRKSAIAGVSDALVGKGVLLGRRGLCTMDIALCLVHDVSCLMRYASRLRPLVSCLSLLLACYKQSVLALWCVSCIVYECASLTYPSRLLHLLFSSSPMF